MNNVRVLKDYKKQLNNLLQQQNIKVKKLFNLDDNNGYMVFLRYKEIDLIQLNFLKRDILKIFNCSNIRFMSFEKYELVMTIYKPKEFLNYEQVELQEHELLLGYNQDGYIIADMSKYPGILISGLPNQGKSKMVNYMLRNLNGTADILVLNGFKDDYDGFNLVVGIKAIAQRIQAILELKEVRKKALYLVIDEMQILAKNKKIQEQLKELLSISRHFNIFIIGIIQNASKDNCSFKDLFNCRVSFRQIDSSSYGVCLGTAVEKGLEQREFYFLDNQLVKGYTFTI